MKKSKGIRARCPVCLRVVTVSSRGGLHSHGNRMHASWEKCRRVGAEADTRQWQVDEDGVLVAPEKVGEVLWDVRAVVENWAPKGMSRDQISRLVALLRSQWDELNRALLAERRARRSADRRARATRALDTDTAQQLIAPVVANSMQGYTDPEQVTHAVVEALMGWTEAEHEQA